MSPFSQFMALSAVYGVAEGEPGQMSATWGLMGEIKRVHRDFTSWVIASYSANGINRVSCFASLLFSLYVLVCYHNRA